MVPGTAWSAAQYLPPLSSPTADTRLQLTQELVISQLSGLTISETLTLLTPLLGNKLASQILEQPWLMVGSQCTVKAEKEY